MNERLKLNQLQGNNPEFGFDYVIRGAKALYDSALIEMSHYLPSFKLSESEFHNSNLLKHLHHVKDYVLNHEYKVVESDKYEWGKEFDNNILQSARSWPWPKSKKPLEIPEELIIAIDAIHGFFEWQFKTLSMINSELDLSIRCFLLFAQAAKLRLMVDYAVISGFRSEEENAEDVCYFTFNELALLTSIVCHKKDPQKTRNIDNKKLNVFPEMVQEASISSINYPAHQEFDYLSKGRTIGSRPVLIARENAIIWLHDKSIPYTFTSFTG